MSVKVRFSSGRWKRLRVYASVSFAISITADVFFGVTLNICSQLLACRCTSVRSNMGHKFLFL